MDLVLIAERVSAPSTDLGDSVQIGAYIILQVDISHEALEAEGIDWGQLGWFVGGAATPSLAP